MDEEEECSGFCVCKDIKERHTQEKKMKMLTINFAAFVEIYSRKRNDHSRSITKDTELDFTHTNVDKVTEKKAQALANKSIMKSHSLQNITTNVKNNLSSYHQDTILHKN